VRAKYHPLRRTAGTSLLFFFFSAQLLLSYEMPLDPHSVREGYFLGQRNDESLARFLSAYSVHLPLPEKGPWAEEIQLLTPYAQVVDISRRHTTGYSAQQAAQNYKDRGDLIELRVRIELTNTYGPIESRPAPKGSGVPNGIAPRPTDFWKDFQIQLVQSERDIEPLDTYGEPIFNRDSRGSGSLAGAQVWLVYDANDVASSDATVIVTAPIGQKYSATFALAKLR